MKNVEVTDGPFDARLYIKKLSVSGDITDKIQKIIGVKSDGSEVAISFTVTADKKIVDLMIDQATFEAVNELYRKVSSGEITAGQATKVEPQFTSLKIVMDPTYQVKPNEGIVANITMGINDPYNIKQVIPGNDQRNIVKNGSSSKGKIISTSEIDFNLSSEASATIIPIKEEVYLTKSTTLNTVTSVGGPVKFDIKFNAKKLSPNRTLVNPQIIDLLPIGLDYERYEVLSTSKLSYKNIEIIDNYKSTGRKAIVVTLNDFSPNSDSEFMIDVYGKINNYATPNGVTTENNNINEVYFLADNFKEIPSTVSTSGTSKIADKFDLNGNGKTNDIILGANSKFIAIFGNELRSEKYIKKDGGQFVMGGIQTNYGESFTYRLTTKNYTNNPINNLVFYDEFPNVGDEKNNPFSNVLDGAVVAPSGFTVYYTTEKPVANKTDAINDASKWSTSVSDYSQVKAIKVVLNAGSVVGPMSIVNVDVPMKAPTYVDSTYDTLKTINYFYSSTEGGANLGITNGVYNQLPLNFSVSKTWIGR